jgi:hypothetical protein
LLKPIPEWVVAIRFARFFVQRRVGITIGDAVNIALLFLTLMSLVLALFEFLWLGTLSSPPGRMPRNRLFT